MLMLISEMRAHVSLPKDVPIHLFATPRTVNRSTPQRKSSNAESTAVKVICAMEPKCQWSAPSCCWHALLQLLLDKFQDKNLKCSSP